MERLHAVERSPPESDGIRAFTALYRAVTEAVDERVRRGRSRTRGSRDGSTLSSRISTSARCGHTWSGRTAVARGRRCSKHVRDPVSPIQFALAGMNAHINRDLPLALVETCRARDIVPMVRGCPSTSTSALDPLLAETEARVRADFATGLVGLADETLRRARQRRRDVERPQRASAAAWVNAEMLGRPRRPFAGARFVVTLDRLVGLAGRGLLRRSCPARAFGGQSPPPSRQPRGTRRRLPQYVFT